MKFSFSRAELSKSGKFLAGLVVAFFGLSLLSKLAPLEAVEGFVASVALAGLGLLGIGGSLEAGPGVEPVVMRVAGLSNPVAIGYLCTGLLETMVLASAVLASFGIPWKKRLKGAGLGVLISFIFNILRIDLTLLMVRWQGLEIGELAHDLFFRLALFLTVAGYYAGWFWQSAGPRK